MIPQVTICNQVVLVDLGLGDHPASLAVATRGFQSHLRNDQNGYSTNASQSSSLKRWKDRQSLLGIVGWRKTIGLTGLMQSTDATSIGRALDSYRQPSITYPRLILTNAYWSSFADRLLAFYLGASYRRTLTRLLTTAYWLLLISKLLSRIRNANGHLLVIIWDHHRDENHL